MEMDDLWVNKMSKNGEEAFEVSKEGRVIKGPLTRLIGVPLTERKRVGNGQPVAMDFQVCAVIGWY